MDSMTDNLLSKRVSVELFQRLKTAHFQKLWRPKITDRVIIVENNHIGIVTSMHHTYIGINGILYKPEDLLWYPTIEDIIELLIPVFIKYQGNNHNIAYNVLSEFLIVNYSNNNINISTIEQLYFRLIDFCNLHI